MSNQKGGDGGVSPGKGRDLLLLILALCGFLICLLLSFLKFTGGLDALAGCGSSGCAEILSSTWSTVFGIPVSLAGLVVYPALMVSLLPQARHLFFPLLGILSGSIGWFILVQALLLRRFCPWCMAAHGIALSIVILGMLRKRKSADWRGASRGFSTWGGVSFLSIALMQLYGPRPETYRIATVKSPVSYAPVHSRGIGRMIGFDGGKKTFNVTALPLLGRPDAKHVLVEYFDYQCPACGIMSGFIEALVAKHPEEVAVILLPVPLEDGCNPHLTPEGSHMGSCDITLISLAVWRKDPAAFPVFHRELMANPSLEAALNLASPILGETVTIPFSTRAWIKELIAANISDWKILSNPSAKLPKLMIRNRRILHGLPSGREDFIRVLEKELDIKY